MKKRPELLILFVLLSSLTAESVIAKAAPSQHKPVSTRATKPSTAVKADSDVDASGYMDELRKRMGHYWHPPRNDDNLVVVVSFKINSSGQLSQLKLDRLSGDPSMDRKAIEAVAQASPFPALPKGFPKAIDIQFTFSYNAVINKAYQREHPSFEGKLCADLLVKARRLAEKRDWDGAVAMANQALSVKPGDGEALEMASKYLLETVKQSQPDEVAISTLHKSLVLDPFNVVAVDLLNERLKKQGNDPKSFDVLAEYARKLAKQEDFDAAIFEMTRALKLKRDDGAQTQLAKMFSDRIAFERVKRWTDSVDKRSTAENHTGLGSAFEMLGESEKARVEYQKALELDPNYKMARDLLDKLTKQADKATVITTP